ncbi:MAG: PIN domain-containing protein [Streptosporangiales bacterium]|nr:PIN domain-containing protein [Streptosporangiales bacterium]
MADRHGAGLLDTCVLIDLPQLPEAALPAASAISALSLAELSAGLHTTKDPNERARRMARVQRIEASVAPLPFGADAARQYGVLVALTLAYGRNPRPRRLDLMVAATAVAHDLPLFTTNVGDFQGLEGAVKLVEVPPHG